MSRLVRLATVTLGLAVLAGAQESRGTIQGTVQDPQGAIIAGANVVVSNNNTQTTSTTKSNEAGRFVVPLLMPGRYTLTVDFTGFKKEVREGIVLLTGDVRNVEVTLQIGAASESVTITGEVPIIDVTHTDNGMALDERTVRDLPVMTNVVTSMIQFVPGVNAGGSASQLLGPHSTIGGSDYNNGSGVGGNVWTIDGAFSNGSGRNTSNLPSVNAVSEVKVIDNTFDGSFGHTVGLGITITTKSGTNDFHGDASENYWSQRWQGSNLFTKKLYYQNVQSLLAKGDTAGASAALAKPIQPSGHSNLYGFNATGPLWIPHVINAKNKVFWSLNFNGERDKKPETANTYPHVVPSGPEKTGDFTDLYGVKSDGLNYQLYDPFSVKVDTSRTGTHYIRTPLPGNILPASYVNMGAPVYKNYTKYWPDPNNWFDKTLAQNAGATDYLAVTTPYNWIFDQWSGRMDINATDKLRVFGRFTRNHFVEDRSDWTYFIVKGFNNSYSGGNTGVIRDDENGVLDFVYTLTPSTMLHAAGSVSNWLTTPTTYPYPFTIKPSGAGLPSYMDEYCGNWCYIPLMNISGYSTNGLSGTPNPQYSRFYDYNADVYHNRGTHQFRFGANFRQQTRSQHNGNSDGTYGFNNTYFRQYDDGGPNGNYNPGTLGLSWASFMMGLPTSANVSNNASWMASNQFLGFFAQDTWRITQRLTLTLSLRAERENGVKGRHDDWIVRWDPNAQLPISTLAQDAFAVKTASQVPEISPSSFIVKGGPLYAGTQGAPSRAWESQLMWLPRVGIGYQLNSKTIIRGGYGLYYDTLDINAIGYGLNQTGFSVGTSTTFTTTQGVTWGSNGACGSWCNAGTTLTSPLADPFPVRPNSGNSRFNVPVGNVYGPMSLLAISGTPNTNAPYNVAASKHPRMQRWRLGIERQLTSHDVVSFGYTGGYTSNMNIQVNQFLLPSSYYYFGNSRPVNASGATISCASGVTNATLGGCLEDTNFGANVPNPFNIGNLSALQSSNPALYSALSGQGFFTSQTISKVSLLRPYPNGYFSLPNPIGHARETSFDVAVNHRFSRGLVGSFGYTYFDSRFANSFLQPWNPFDSSIPQAPVWQPNNIPPHRFTATWVYDLPFGKGRQWVRNKFADVLVGGWTVSGNYVWSRGTLIGMPNAFYYGDTKNIKLDSPTFAEWFNTAGCVLPGQTLGPGDVAVPLGQPCTSGWEKRTAMQPGTYQVRSTPLFVDGVRNPNFGQLNASLARDFKFGFKDHPLTFQVRGDVLNVMNHSYFGSVGTTVTSGVGSFGAITQGSTVLNRFIQVQGHIRW
jgi:hypothetical protein